MTTVNANIVFNIRFDGIMLERKKIKHIWRKIDDFPIIVIIMIVTH